jgi:uncharacterized protein YlxP (DUF503 family)
LYPSHRLSARAYLLPISKRSAYGTIHPVVSVTLLTLHIHLPGCTSLKEKRSKIKPILARLHREFNCSVAEVDRQDSWYETIIACAMVSNASVLNQQMAQQVVQFVESTWPDQPVVDHHIETL